MSLLLFWRGGVGGPADQTVNPTGLTLLFSLGNEAVDLPVELLVLGNRLIFQQNNVTVQIANSGPKKAQDRASGKPYGGKGHSYRHLFLGKTYR